MDKVELFGNIAHNLVPRVECLLLEVEYISAEPLQDLVKSIQICIEKISRHIKKENWSRQEAEDFFKKYRKLAIIAMAGHQYLIKEQTKVSQLANQMTDLFKRKNADYGDSFGMSMKKWGFYASIIRIEDKANRLDSLVCKKNKSEVKDESIADTFIDLANYAIMTILYDHLFTEEMKSAELDEEKEDADE